MRTWHFGKCRRAFLNTQRYAGVLPLSVDGGSVYILSRVAMRRVVDFVSDPRRNRMLEKNRFVDFFEDQFVSSILDVTGITPTDFSGHTFTAEFAAQFVTRAAADGAGLDARNICDSLAGDATGRMSAEMQALFRAR